MVEGATDNIRVIQNKENTTIEDVVWQTCKPPRHPPAMVKLRSVQESNRKLSNATPGQISLFYGVSVRQSIPTKSNANHTNKATSGLGLATLTEYARHANQPKVYIVGRSEAKLSSIVIDLKAINPQGSYNVIKSETELFRDADEACRQFQSKEKRLDLLVMSPGYLKPSRQRARLSSPYLATSKNPA